MSTDPQLLTDVQTMLTEVSEFFTLTQPKVFRDITAVSYCVENTFFFKLIGDGTPVATAERFRNL
jgi:hypothetical protein